jgi:hypothetical protein
MPIRPLTDADCALWQPLWERYLSFYNATLSPEVHDLTFTRLTSGAEPMGGFLAFDDTGAAVGLVTG